MLRIGWSGKNLQKQIKNAGGEAVVRTAVSAGGASFDTKELKEKGRQLLDRLGRCDLSMIVLTPSSLFQPPRASSSFFEGGSDLGGRSTGDLSAIYRRSVGVFVIN